jgi:hypothetical protein
LIASPPRFPIAGTGVGCRHRRAVTLPRKSGFTMAKKALQRSNWRRGGNRA